MKIAVKIDQPIEKELDVQFPLFLQGGEVFDSGGWYETYSRIDSDGWEHEITINDRGEWAYERSRVDLPTSLGYRLVERQYAYSVVEPEKFYSKLVEMQKALAEIPPCEEASKK